MNFDDYPNAEPPSFYQELRLFEEHKQWANEAFKSLKAIANTPENALKVALAQVEHEKRMAKFIADLRARVEEWDIK